MKTATSFQVGQVPMNKTILNVLCFVLLLCVFYPMSLSAQDMDETLGNPLDPEKSRFGRVVSKYNPDDGYESSKGINLACRPNQPVFAAHSGTIRSTFYNYCGPKADRFCGHGLGNVICVSSVGYYDEGGLGELITCYANLSGTKWQLGTIVQKGFLIGYCGKTGFATQEQLHFRCYVNGNRMDPEKCIGAKTNNLSTAKIPFPKNPEVATLR